jgi:pyrimidine deaminase RibD-like protein
VNSEDIALMEQALFLAEECKPRSDSIPKVGAIIAVGGTILGRGRRGTGAEGDDQHAENNALDKVGYPSQPVAGDLDAIHHPGTLYEARSHERA